MVRNLPDLWVAAQTQSPKTHGLSVLSLGRCDVSFRRSRRDGKRRRERGQPRLPLAQQQCTRDSCQVKGVLVLGMGARGPGRFFFRLIMGAWEITQTRRPGRSLSPSLEGSWPLERCCCRRPPARRGVITEKHRHRRGRVVASPSGYLKGGPFCVLGGPIPGSWKLFSLPWSLTNFPILPTGDQVLLRERC